MIHQEVNFLRPHLLPKPSPLWWYLPAIAGVLLVGGFFAVHYWENRQLAEEVESLGQQVAAKRRVLEQSLPPSPPPVLAASQMATIFQAIAQTAQAGVWLTRILVEEKKILLEGRTSAPNYSFTYSRRLAEHPVFAHGWHFSSLAVTPVVGERHAFLFTVVGEKQP